MSSLEPDSATRYPRLIRRVQALLIDGVVVPFGAMGVLLLVTRLGLKGPWAALPPLLTFFILEPFLVSVSGGTIGHHVRGLRVVDAHSGGRIGIVRACLRFMFKIVLGVPSLVAFFVTRRYQALHDLASRSVVVLRAPHRLDAYDKRHERRFRREGYRYPSRYRQAAVIVAYNVVFILLSTMVFDGVTAGLCAWLPDFCLPLDFLLNVAWEIAVLVCLGATIFHARSGRLPGCRAQRIEHTA